MADRPTPTYWDYLQLDHLLDLQGGLEEDEGLLMPDELHFIIVHQVFELWFKLILRELRLARDHLAAPRVPEESIPFVVHHMRRVSEILELAVEQFRVMETLTPQDFLAFRDKLTPASGFQSYQLREIEIVMGLGEEQRPDFGDAHALDHIKEVASTSSTGRMAWARIERAQREVTLRQAMHDWLYRTPIQGIGPGDPGDPAAVEQFLAEYLAAHAQLLQQQEARLLESGTGEAAGLRARFARSAEQAQEFLHALDVPPPLRPRAQRIRAGILFIESYRELPLLAWPRILVDTAVELDERLVLWRTRHARMVERTIGRRIGTGGSSGVDYLDETARRRIFPELWTVRTLLLPREALPVLRRAELYGFAQ